VTITLSEVGGDVVANASGSLDLSGLHFVEPASIPSLIYPAVAALTVGPTYAEVENYDGLTAWPEDFGPGGTRAPDSSSGDFFGVGRDTFAIQRYYQNFSPLSGSSIWQNRTFDELGVTPGSYTWSWSTDSITLNVVPEPSLSIIAVAGGCTAGYAGALRRGRP
jgi:hypothetical protein